MRELETVRAFLTGQGLSSVIDLVFAIVAIGVMYLYSSTLTLIVLLSIPCYMLIAFLIRPILRESINERFLTARRSVSSSWSSRWSACRR